MALLNFDIWAEEYRDELRDQFDSDAENGQLYEEFDDYLLDSYEEYLADNQ